MSPVHLDIVWSSPTFIFVPARISSFSDAGYFINELICSYYYCVPFFFIFYLFLLTIYLNKQTHKNNRFTLFGEIVEKYKNI